MTSEFATTGITGATYRALFRKQIMAAKPPVLGLAIAYVSTSGFSLVKKILDDGNVQTVRLVTDTKDGVTHPMALKKALDSGWEVRVVDTLAGTFHPKLYVGAQSFHGADGLSGLSFAITGSPNLSYSAFVNNGECAFWTSVPGPSASRAWLECWNVGSPLTQPKLRDYEKYFALRNRRRSAPDIVTLGVSDLIPPITAGTPTGGLSPPKSAQKVISETVASVAWAGLQSFTGEYYLQVEFPKEAGLVLRRIFGKTTKGSDISLHCADGTVRTFKFRYYEHNGMFRLNVPNATPLADWARTNKAGIAYVEQHEDKGTLYFEILPPSPPMVDVVDRSLALGTWGRTPTRLYGWY